MRRLGAILAVAMLLVLTVAVPADARKPAPAPVPYISRITGGVIWLERYPAGTGWDYALLVKVTARNLPVRPSYVACIKVSVDGMPYVGEAGFAAATRAEVTIDYTGTALIVIPPDSRTLTLTSAQLMQVRGGAGCCTPFGPVLMKAETITLPHQRPPQDYETVFSVFDWSFDAEGHPTGG